MATYSWLYICSSCYGRSIGFRRRRAPVLSASTSQSEKTGHLHTPVASLDQLSCLGFRWHGWCEWGCVHQSCLFPWTISPFSCIPQFPSTCGSVAVQSVRVYLASSSNNPARRGIGRAFAELKLVVAEAQRVATQTEDSREGRFLPLQPLADVAIKAWTKRKRSTRPARTCQLSRLTTLTTTLPTPSTATARSCSRSSHSFSTRKSLVL